MHHYINKVQPFKHGEPCRTRNRDTVEDIFWLTPFLCEDLTGMATVTVAGVRQVVRKLCSPWKTVLILLGAGRSLSH
jgi:hypothetical protein